MDWRHAWALVVGVAFLVPAAAAGRQREQPKLIEEFLTAEPCYVEPQGEVQLSSALDYRKPVGDWRVPVAAQFGITDRIEGEIDGIYLSIPSDGGNNRGPGDMDVGLHYAVRPYVEKVALTIGVDVGLPTGNKNKDLGSGQVDAEFFGIAGMKIGRGELHVTGLVDVGGDAVDPGFYAAAAYPLGGLRVTLETNVTVNPDRPGEQADTQTEDKVVWVVVSPGLFHRATPDIEYGLGVPIGLTTDAPDWGIIGRLTVEFEL